MLSRLASLTSTGPYLLTTCAGEGRPWWASTWRRESVEILAQGVQGDRAREKTKELDKYVNWGVFFFSIHPIVYLVFLWMSRVVYQTCDIFSIPQRSADSMFPSPILPSALKEVGHSHPRSDHTILLWSMFNDFPCAAHVLRKTRQQRQGSVCAAPCPHM